jgi:catechol 2,3-dioxygenase-like lactoylglutathione lyase family enzyme
LRYEKTAQAKEAQMIKTTGVYHMGIPCNDVDRAVKFYTEILGMTIATLNRDDMGGGLKRADLRCGDDTVVLFQRPQPLHSDVLEREGATHQAFHVSRADFELAKQKMAEWGVKVHAVPSVDRSTGSGFYFFDTEGNLLQLYAPPKQQESTA